MFALRAFSFYTLVKPTLRATLCYGLDWQVYEKGKKSGKHRRKGEKMISPTVKHCLITELDEARYTLSHRVDLTPDEQEVQDDLGKLIKRVRDLPVEGVVLSAIIKI